MLRNGSNEEEKKRLLMIFARILSIAMYYYITQHILTLIRIKVLMKKKKAEFSKFDKAAIQIMFISMN
jgi:hypothetical protein